MKSNSVTGKISAETVTISRAEYEADKAYISELEQKNRWLMEQFRLFRKKQFGASSEKATQEIYEQLSLLFNEAEACLEEERKEAASVSAVEVRSYIRKRKSGNVRDILPKDTEVVEVEHTLSEEERTCPECGEVMDPIGMEVSETLELIPAKAILHRDIYYSYACQNCKENAETVPVIRTPKEPALIPGSYASAEAVAHIAVQKFKMGSPLYRQEKEWNAAGVMLSRQTMSNWLIRCAKDWILPIREALREQLVHEHDLLHADETEVQVLHEEGRSAQARSYMWLYRTSGDAEHPIVLYNYQPGRGQEYPNAFLDGFHGYLQTDGYSAYNAAAYATRIGCWAHARRLWVKCLPKGVSSADSKAIQAFEAVEKIFDAEKRFVNVPLEQIGNERRETLKPLFDEYWNILAGISPLGGSGIDKAVTYSINQKEYLENVLLDNRIELTNNLAERAIKPFVIGRKNWLFSDTDKGADASARCYSIIESAKLNGLNVFAYLSHLLTELPKLGDVPDIEQIDKLLPWSDELPEFCK